MSSAMKKFRLISLVAVATSALMVSCSKEISVNDTIVPENYTKVPVSLVASGEQQSKVVLDFEQSPNIQWSDEDVIAVFVGERSTYIVIERTICIKDIITI